MPLGVEHLNTPALADIARSDKAMSIMIRFISGSRWLVIHGASCIGIRISHATLRQ